MTSKKEEAARLAAAALDPGLLPRFERRAPRVAMNAVTDFTGELDKIEKDLNDAKRKLALFEGSLPTRELDPTLIKPSRFANRIDGSFSGPSFEGFKQEIASSGINVQPIKVRSIGDGAYEIVFGHRRHRACLELGFSVLAVIQENMSDKELFEEMSRENEQRKDLSAYELALHYKRGIDLKLYKNWSEIAAVLGKTKGLVSRYSALADLPRAVIDAFASPNDIQPKWAEKLRQVIEADAPAVMQVAKTVKNKGLNARAVFESLINQPEKPFTRVNFPAGIWIESGLKVTIEIDKTALSAEGIESLRSFVASLQGKSSPG
ncbi:ParB/RepB/Spo0J family partition protein [Caballeronia sordidicola]|jgi:ParB family chromosome partitioning protein|uniref:Chromosome (Plasmid) partitioning protein ParB n=1 Tax=Caballeronia sordidicola TaxID=196367 RepID=A0A226XC16_CABSO|nr:ParB/RepB/Spo0J family partition protein [Caballeronia sordidicola]OXC80388.1 Chromosome (plasmid) partitioning protein ParB [Caballeronia sordidicola]